MNQIICGDAIEELQKIDSNSIDLGLTDPPYGYGFMGKDWDKAVPPVSLWKEFFRVLKPGAFCFVMSAPRQDVLSRMICNLGDAGFDMHFTSIYWTYASGFPKAGNIGKLVDKRFGVEKARNPEFDEVRIWLKNLVKKKGLTYKQIDMALGNENSHKASHYLDNSQPQIPTPKDWKVLKKLLDVDVPLNRPNKDDILILFEREIIGERKVHKGVAFSSEGKEVLPITTPATPQAKALDGSYAGYQPKPAVEAIIVCMKPLSEKTFVDQALKNGKGITWLDDCRVPYESEGDKPVDSDCGWKRLNAENEKQGFRPNAYLGEDKKWEAPSQGRFPANLICSDDILNDGKVRKCPVTKGITTSGKAFWHKDKPIGYKKGFPDQGSYSRYFDLDKWWNEQIKKLPDSVQKTFPFCIVPKAAKKEKWFWCRVCKVADHSSQRNCHNEHDTHCHTCGVDFNSNDKETHKNHKTETNIIMHPTIKPLKLMSYLTTLGSRPDDMVLDPFMGSGTTLVAAKQLGRQYIGIDNDSEQVEIAKKRVASIQPQLALLDK